MDKTVLESLSFPKSCTDDVIHPTDCSVRKEGSLNPPNITDTALKPSPLKKHFFENGQMPDFSNTA
jgi:hypothetical protein